MAFLRFFHARPLLTLAGLAAAATVVRALVAQTVATPWILTDELMYSELAKNLADEGRLLVRDEPLVISFAYPLAIAPAWLADSVGTAYALARVINAVAMSLAVVPVYLWSRRFLSPERALLAAALTLLLPVYGLTGTLMTENVFFPLCLLALFAVALALERPTVARQLSAVGAIALACSARPQGVLLLLVLPAAVCVWALLERSAAVFRPFGVSLAAFALVAAALTPFGIVRRAVSSAWRVYEEYRADYSALEVLRGITVQLGDLSLAAGLAPVSALLVLLALREGSRSERAFLAVTAAACACIVPVAALWGTKHPEGVKERQMAYLLPLLLMALLLWLERGAPRPRRLTALAVVVPAALVLALPLGELFESDTVFSDSFALVPFYGLSRVLPGDALIPRLLIAAVALAAAIAFARAPRRLPAGIAVLLAATSVAVVAGMRHRSVDIRELAGAEDDPSWIDRELGPGGRAVFLNTSLFEPEAIRADDRWVRSWIGRWGTEFWNRGFGEIYDLGTGDPSLLAETTARLDNGRVTPEPRTPFVLADPRVEVVGQELSRKRYLVLYRFSPPLRLAAASEGVFVDGWMGGNAAYSRYQPGPAGELTVSLSGRTEPATVELVLRSGGDVLRRRETLPPRAVHTYLLRTTPPFRVEVHVEPTFSRGGDGLPPRDLGAKVAFSFAA